MLDNFPMQFFFLKQRTYLFQQLLNLAKHKFDHINLKTSKQLYISIIFNYYNYMRYSADATNLRLNINAYFYA